MLRLKSWRWFTIRVRGLLAQQGSALHFRLSDDETPEDAETDDGG